MKNKLLYLLLLLPVLFCACSDSDDDGTKEKDDTFSDTELAQYSSVGKILYWLAEVDEMPEDLSSATYEPTIGIPLDAANPFVRTVKLDSLQDATTYFVDAVSTLENLLVETADGYSLSLLNLKLDTSGKLQDFGTLVFHKETGSTRIAYIDIDIPCIPNLSRIDLVYNTGDNDGFESPYKMYDLVYVDGWNWETGNHRGYFICLKESTWHDGNSNAGILVRVRDGQEGNYLPSEDYGNRVPWTRWKEREKEENEQSSKGRHEIANLYLAFRKEITISGLVYNYLNGDNPNKKPYGNKDEGLKYIFPNGFDFHSKNDGGGIYNGGNDAALVTDGWYGEHVWYLAHYYRVCEYYDVPNGYNIYSGSANRQEFWWIYDKEWNKFAKKKRFYTVDGILFWKNSLFSGWNVFKDYNPVYNNVYDEKNKHTS